MRAAETMREDDVDGNRVHSPVLLQDCLDLVTPALSRDGAVVVDCTLGLAGHATAFLQACPRARLIGIDRDQEALDLATGRMDRLGLSDRFIPVHAPFDRLGEVLDQEGVEEADVVFMDLGLSSLQIDEVDRGFSYSHESPLDMRMDTGQELTAADILASYSQQDLTRIFRDYGEERFASRIARAVIETRDRQPIRTSSQLVSLVESCVPRSHRAPGNPAKRVFQALRIEVNGELDRLARTLPQAALKLRVGGRLVVESYHSLEDRTVKRFMAEGLVAHLPHGLPAVPVEAAPFFRDLTHGALKADRAEEETNPRSASVRLRAVELTREIPGTRRRSLAGRARGDRYGHRRLRERS